MRIKGGRQTNLAQYCVVNSAKRTPEDGRRKQRFRRPLFQSRAGSALSLAAPRSTPGFELRQDLLAWSVSCCRATVCKLELIRKDIWNSRMCVIVFRAVQCTSFGNCRHFPDARRLSFTVCTRRSAEISSEAGRNMVQVIAQYCIDHSRRQPGLRCR